MKKAHPYYSVTELCEVLDVASSSYYYQAQAPSDTESKLINEIKCIAEKTGNTYGKRRMRVELTSLGYSIELYCTASLMKKAKVVAICPTRHHRCLEGESEAAYAPTY